MPLENLTPPSQGTKIGKNADGSLDVPNDPIIPFIEGDGIGPDIWKATQNVLDAAVRTAYGTNRRIEWFEIYAGEKAQEKFNEWLPEDTFTAIRDYRVAIKGPLTTPVGGGFRSLNVTIRQVLELYACVRPVRYFSGVPSPMRHPEKVDVVIFRENTEDVYSGVEWEANTPEANQVIEFLTGTMGAKIRSGSGVGIKPISKEGTQNLTRRAIQYAIEQGRRTVTLVHKGNIMKFTEGAFRNWGYELAAAEFPEQTISEDELWEKHDGKLPDGKILINDRIADAMFQQLLLRPDEYEVLVTPNLNGDYLSDAAVGAGRRARPGPGREHE